MIKPSWLFRRGYYPSNVVDVVNKVVFQVMAINHVTRLAAIRFMQAYLDILEAEVVRNGEE